MLTHHRRKRRKLRKDTHHLSDCDGENLKSHCFKEINLLEPQHFLFLVFQIGLWEKTKTKAINVLYINK